MNFAKLSKTVDTKEASALSDADKTADERNRKKSLTRLPLALFGLFVGCAMICYPYVSDYIHKKAAQNVVVSQESALEKTDKAALSEEMQKALDYNSRLAKGKAHVSDPFDDSDIQVDDNEYKSLLNLAGDGVMGSIVIPKIKIKLPIYHTTSDAVLASGVGHMSSTSLPVGGESSHAALAGHNGLPSMKIFDDLNKLEVGDEFAIEVLGEEHIYRIYSIETVLPEETQSLLIQQGKDLVTLITCTPYGVNDHRLLVHAERVDAWSEDNQQAAQSVTGGPSAEDSLIPLSLIGLSIAIGLILAYLLGFKRRKKKDVEEDTVADVKATAKHLNSNNH